MATLYEVTIQGEFIGQQTVNRLTFASDIDDPTTTNAFNLVRALGFQPTLIDEPADDTVLASMLLAQDANFAMKSITARSLYDVGDFYVVPVLGNDYTGKIISSVSNLPFISQKLFTSRVRADIRAGSLSLTPPPEDHVFGDGQMSAPQFALLQDVALKLNTTVVFTVGEVTTTYRPCVLSKEMYLPDPAKPWKTAYRYYETEDEQFQHSALGVTWSASPIITSQVSRRAGKGR